VDLTTLCDLLVQTGPTCFQGSFSSSPLCQVKQNLAGITYSGISSLGYSVNQHYFYFFQDAIDTNGIDPNGPAPSEDWDGPINNVLFVEVHLTECPPGDNTREIFSPTIDPTRDSNFTDLQ